MQCIWSTATKQPLWRSLIQKRPSIWHGSGGTCTSRLSDQFFYRWSAPSREVEAMAKDKPSHLTFDAAIPPPNIPGQFASMTSAQLSRGAAQAIREASRSSFFDALYVVNSVQLSQQLHANKGLDKQCSTNPSVMPSVPQKLHFNAIDFGKAVSSRLSCHSFLHALLRGGEHYSAGRYAEMMMQQGIRIRKTTLEKIVGSLSSHIPMSIIRRPPRKLSKHAAVGLSIRPEQFTDPGNQAAYRILMHARKSGQDRSKRMYDSLIRGCLMQGEILVGSLLFVLLVKDWQAHAARKKLADEHSNDTEGDSADTPNDISAGGYILDGYSGEDRKFKHLAVHKPRQSDPWRADALTPYPTCQLLQSITKNIESALTQDPDPGGGQAYLQEPLQALANLALLVEEGHIHFGHLSPLVRAIYLCPKTRERIWVRKKREKVQVDGYQYLHGFLLRIIQSFQGNSRLQLPPLDTRTYHSLLHYALRHRLSPALASTVLDHMCTKRKLKPTIETYNILLRSGTLLRRKDITEAVLGVLRQDQQSFGMLVDALAPAQPDEDRTAGNTLGSGQHRPVVQAGAIVRSQRQTSTPAAPVKGKMSKKMRKLQRAVFVLPEQMRSPSEVPVADPVTFSSFVAYLVSTGSPHLMADAVFDVFPELQYDNPEWAELQGHQLRAAQIQARDRCVQRAVFLGPVFLASLLNALAKAGRTALAERIWLLATEAEQASWIPDFCPGVKPWRLSIHAYTSMLQCYANEAVKGVRRKSATSRTGLLDLGSRLHVLGWGRFRYQLQEAKELKRSDAGRELGLMLFRSVVSGKETSFQRKREVWWSRTDVAVKKSRAASKAAEKAARTVKFKDVAEVKEAVEPGDTTELEEVAESGEVVEEESLPRDTKELEEVPLVLPSLKPPVPDVRFFNAALRLVSIQRGMSPRCVRPPRSRARRLVRWANKAFAQRGSTSFYWTPELQEVAEAMVSAGHPVPDGLQHLLVGHWEPGTVTWDPAPPPSQSPFAYPDPPRRAYRSFSVPTVKTRGLPIRHLSTRRRADTRGSS